MAEDTEIAITIIPDEVANVESATKPEPKPEPQVAKAEPQEDAAKAELKAQFEELEKRADREQQLRLAAEQEAARHRQEAEESKKRETSSHLDTIVTAINAAQQEAENAKVAYKAAREAGDIGAEVEAADRLAIARADLRRLDEAKQDVEARTKAPPKRETPQSVDPVEAFARNRTEPTAKWIREHPEYVRSERGMRKLTAADAVAQDEGLIPDTPEYFARVEQYLGIRKPSADGAQKEAPTEASQVQQKPRSVAPPVAPVASVSGSGGNGAGGMAVTLTSREAAAAQDGTLVWNWDDPKGKFKKGEPIGLQEMARRKVMGMKAGLYDRSYAEG